MAVPATVSFASFRRAMWRAFHDPLAFSCCVTSLVSASVTLVPLA